MTDHIEFREDEFSFRQGHAVFNVRTEVAPDSFARVVVEEISGPVEPQMEGEEEA